MASLIVREGRIFQDENAVFLERVTLPTGVAVVAADVTDWDLQVFPINGTATATYQLFAQSPTGVVQTSLQTGSGWTKDTIGWNFKYTLAWDDFAQEGCLGYRFEFKLNTVSHGNIFFVWDVFVDAILSEPAPPP